MITVRELPKNYEYNLMNEFYEEQVIPQIHKIARQIDNDIRGCIKEEMKKYGSIVKRYGDWAKFINKEIVMAYYPLYSKNLLHESLFYRGKHIRDYDLNLIN